MSYRVALAAGARPKFHLLPEHARDALVARAADLVERPWDDDVRVLPGDDTTRRSEAQPSTTAEPFSSSMSTT